MPELLYAALALAAALLCFRWFYTGVVLEMPCWMIYLAHLPVAALVWALQWWTVRWWVSGLGAILLIFCAVEAVRACGWWVMPRREQHGVVIASCGVGALLAAIAGYCALRPLDEPRLHFLATACGPTAALGVIVSAWIYQRLFTGRHANNSRHAWHIALLMTYCALNIWNRVAADDSDAAWWLRTKITVTCKIAMLAIWWIKSTPVSHPRAATV